MKQYYLFITIMFFICNNSIFSQVLNGTVVGDEGPVYNATVRVQGKSTATKTDFEGKFKIELGANEAAIEISALEYETMTQNVKAGTQEFRLSKNKELKELGEVIVTGFSNPKKRIESSVAITTMDSRAISEAAPMGGADLLKSVPGVYVESSAGEAGNNIFVRGIPADGSFRYVSIQEDGMPVVEDPEMMFGNGDNYFRIDETVNRLETVRGGSSSIFASNSPGGIINILTHKGSNVNEGVAKYTTSTFGTQRLDMNFSGPLDKGIKYSLGGFYRVDNGVRNPEYTADKGGQFRASLTKEFDKGSVRVYTKQLNDKTVWYLPIPIQADDNDNYSALPGFDPNYGTLNSQDLKMLTLPSEFGQGNQEDLEDGIHSRVNSFGSQIKFNLGNGWEIEDHIRSTNTFVNFNGLVSIENPTSITDFVTGKMDPSDTNASLSDFQLTKSTSGELVTNWDKHNGNGLIYEMGWWNIKLGTKELANKLQFNKEIKKGLNLSLGYYYSNSTQEANWFWHKVLVDIKDNANKLDLVDTRNGVKYTDNGISQYGMVYLNYDVNTRVNALFGSLDYQINDNLNLDLGLRYEMGKIIGTTEGSSLKDFGQKYNNNVALGTGKWTSYSFDYNELAWSAGLNYKLNKTSSVFVRVSDGFRAPDDNNLVFSLGKGAVVEDVQQYELGYKMYNKYTTLYLSPFMSVFKNIPLSDQKLNSNGNIESSTIYAGANTMGIEVESKTKIKNFQLMIGLTIQSPKYVDFKYTTYTSDSTFTVTDLTGNQVRRIPKFYMNFAPSYELPLNADKNSSLKGILTFRYYGDRFADEGNTNILPGFGELNFTLLFNINKNLSIGATVNNITNSLGITEGNPRIDVGVAGNTSKYRMARPILGRNAMLNLAYRF